MADKEDHYIQAGSWLTKQLSLPVDPQEEHTKIYSQAEISEEFEGLDIADVLEWAFQYRVLTWCNAVRAGRRVSIELVDTTRVKYRLKADRVPSISLGKHSFSIPHASDTQIRITVLIVAIDDENESEKILSNITVNGFQKDQGSSPMEFDLGDLELVLKAWVHLGGSLKDLEGVPSYLAEE